ncbi:MAG: hypothetical protein V3W22_02340 [Thermoplasmata archaeon]
MSGLGEALSDVDPMEGMERGERLLDFLERTIRGRGGCRQLILGMELYGQVQDSLTDQDFGKVNIGGRHPFQNISHIYGVPVEVDYKDKSRLEFVD